MLALSAEGAVQGVLFVVGRGLGHRGLAGGIRVFILYQTRKGVKGVLTIFINL